jgi:mannan endo-1,4-beta-mannosidase
MSRTWFAGASLIVAAACTGNITTIPQPWTIETRAVDAGAMDAGSGKASANDRPAGSSGSSGRADVATSESSDTAETGPHDTYYVQDGVLRDRCGEKVVLRGVNHPTLFIDREGKALPEIAKTGANSVRLFWYAKKGVPISEADAAISRAAEEHMLPILEMHDSTCEWKTDVLDDIEAYWTSQEARDLIEKHKANLIINVANEPSAPNAPAFKLKYTSMLKSIRNAGIHVPVMIDGATCGRDYNMLLTQGPALLAADPDHNLIFSAHLYDPLSADELSQVYADFAQAKLAFVVGEFANKQAPSCGDTVDYAALIAQAQKHDVGWLAWSWGDDDPNTQWNSDCGEFDMTATFAFDSLQGWGKEVAVSLPDSIMNTSKRPYSLENGACR